MSSLDMAGIQICILNLTDHPFWLQYLDDCTEAPSWNGTLSKIFSSSSKSIKIKIIEDEVLNEVLITVGKFFLYLSELIFLQTAGVQIT